jgi:hypothetical protein
MKVFSNAIPLRNYYYQLERGKYSFYYKWTTAFIELYYRAMALIHFNNGLNGIMIL